jgi:hypothetical protein
MDTSEIYAERFDFFNDRRYDGELAATDFEKGAVSLLDTADRENYFALRGVGYDHAQALGLISAHFDSDVSLWENFEALARLAANS